MALLAEEVVEEWLNRQGYFTIRGIKLGVHELDLLAIKKHRGGQVECRHIEVQASMRPVSYICRVPKEQQKLGRAANSAKRSEGELVQGIAEWVEKKFIHKAKTGLMQELWEGQWSKELVLNVVKSEAEVELIRGYGVSILWLTDIVKALADGRFPIASAAGADFIDLIHMGAKAQPSVPADVPFSAASPLQPGRG